MKDLLQKVRSFITFEFATDSNCLTCQFARTHLNYQKNLPHWSTKATKQKVITRYWYVQVVSHFTFIVGPAALVIAITSGQLDVHYWSVVFIAGIISFPVVLFFNYAPAFSGIFLPHLETIKESYDHKQFEQFEKCKRAQLPNATLVLFYYVFDKVSGINSLQCNDHYAELLMKVFGVDQGSIKKNLELILGRKKSLSLRKLTEMQNRFQEAHAFFEEIQFTEGSKILSQLEQKFKNN